MRIRVYIPTLHTVSSTEYFYKRMFPLVFHKEKKILEMIGDFRGMFQLESF